MGALHSGSVTHIFALVSHWQVSIPGSLGGDGGWICCHVADSQAVWASASLLYVLHLRVHP